MANLKQKDSKNVQQVRAIDRLLEVAQKKFANEQNWHSVQKFDDLKKQDSSCLFPQYKISYRKHMRTNNRAQIEQKNYQRQRLRQLIRQNLDNQQQTHQQLYKSQSKQYKNKFASMDFVKNAKLRPFNSNMTFYSVKKQQKQRIFNSSLNFHQNIPKIKYIQQQVASTNRYRQMKSNDQKYSSFYTPSNDLKLPRSNKSEIIRKILNQMQADKQKYNYIHFPKNQKNKHQSEEDIYQQLNSFELQQINKYKKFIPFKENQGLLLKKVIENQNVWMKKFKQSWIRRKNDVEAKKSNFKKLILKD